VLNVASTNNRIRIPSRTLLQRTLTAAARVGAAGLVVHGGHVTAHDDPAAGVANWVKTLQRLEPTDPPVPLLVENTAGGDGAMARTLDQIDRLWTAIAPAAAARGVPVGFVVDTAHAFSAGLDLTTLVADVRSRTGRVDLVHANDSRDPAGSGRDRHADLGAGTIGADRVVSVAVEAALHGADVVLETPGVTPGHAADVRRIRAAISAARGGTTATGGAGGAGDARW
jgi:deoxyribonuclease-4